VFVYQITRSGSEPGACPGLTSGSPCMVRMQCVTVLGARVLSFTNNARVMPSMASWTIRRETRAGGHRPFLFCCYKSNKQRKRLGGRGHPKKRKTCLFYTRNREKRKTCPFSLLKTCPFFSSPATADCSGRSFVRTIGKRKTCPFSLLKTCPFFSSPVTADYGGRCSVQTWARGLSRRRARPRRRRHNHR
jgi:hypothetical protein